VARQDHLCLDAHEQCGNFQEFARPIEPQRLDTFDRRQELRRDLRDRNVEDVDVLLADQVQEQVERPLESLQLDDERAVGRAGDAGIDDRRMRVRYGSTRRGKSCRDRRAS
jgi:hypothetical protein